VTKPIDPVTWERWRTAWRRSRQIGRDFAEYLNQVGLLLTPARRAELLAGELRRAARELENMSATRMMINDGRNSNSALDMQRATVTWLRQRADRAERGE
jgi:hypothetical protein